MVCCVGETVNVHVHVHFLLHSLVFGVCTRLHVSELNLEICNVVNRTQHISEQCEHESTNCTTMNANHLPYRVHCLLLLNKFFHVEVYERDTNHKQDRHAVCKNSHVTSSGHELENYQLEHNISLAYTWLAISSTTTNSILPLCYNSEIR